MSITSCYDALRSVIAAGVSAKSQYTGIPNQAPQRLPAVVVRWTNTEPASQSFSSLVTTKYARNAMRRVHTFEAVVVIGSSGQIKDEDIAARATAQSLLDAIDDDTELGGACVLASVNNVSGGLLEWDQQAMYTVRANVSVTEDV